MQVVEEKIQGSGLGRELEEVPFKREAGKSLVNWREVPLGEKTAAGIERLKEGILVEVIQGETLGIQGADLRIREVTTGIQRAGSGEEQEQTMGTDLQEVSQPRLKLEVRTRMCGRLQCQVSGSQQRKVGYQVGTKPC